MNLQVHHIKHVSKGGTNRLANLMTLCKECHDKHHKKGLKLPRQKSKCYIAASHVQQGKNYLKQELKKIALLETTFGFITSYYRRQEAIEKSHVVDAVIIANREAKTEKEYFLTRCVEFRKRSLHEAIARKGTRTPNTTQKRSNKNTFRHKGFQRFDCVKVFGQIGFITGFTGKNECRIIDIHGKYIHRPNKSYNNIPLPFVKKLFSNQGRISWIILPADSNPAFPPHK